MMKPTTLFLGLCSLLSTLPAQAEGGGRITASPQSGAFIENRSQWATDVLFKTSLPGLNFSIAKGELIYNFFKQEMNADGAAVKQKGQQVHMRFAGANPGISFRGTEQENPVYNYFLGKDKSRWVRNARSFKTLTAENIYDGIDAVVTLDNGLPRYDFIVRPGGDPRKISMDFSGADAVSTDSEGNLTLSTQYGTIYHGRLLAYQQQGEVMTKVECSFAVSGATVQFNCGAYNPDLPLIIDPTVYSTYAGGGQDDELTSVVVEESGNIIAAGWSASNDYPSVAGAYETMVAGKDAVITKFNSSMTTVLSSTYIGGGGDDAIRDINIDNAGNICVVGETSSTDFPTESGAISQVSKGQIDAFACRLNNNLSDLTYSTYIGGLKDDFAYALKTDGNNNIYITGKTASTDFPKTLSVFDLTHNGSYDAYVLKLSSTGTLLFGTFIGGGSDDVGYDITVDNSSNIYIAGETSSSNFQTSPIPSWSNGQAKPYDNVYNGGVDGFAAKFNNTLSTATFSTFLGGAGDDRIRGISLGPSNVVLVAGETNSNDFPVSPAVSGGLKSGVTDIFAAKFDAPGKLLTFTWIMGASSEETVKTAIVDTEGSYYIAGTTTSSNFPATADATKKNLTGTSDGFIVKLNTNGIQNAGLIGGNKTDVINGLTLDSKNNLYMAGVTVSTNFPTSENAFKNSLAGTSDGFLAKEVFATLDMISPAGGEKWCGGIKQTLQWLPNGFPSGETYALYISSGEGQPWQKIDSNLSAVSYQWTIPTTIPTGTQYKIRVVSSSGVTKQSGAITLSQGPVITAQPQGTTICEGQPLSLSVQVVSTSPTYQWYLNGNVIKGATQPTLSLANAGVAESGSYTVKITGLCSATPITSQVAVITVNPATNITLQPENANITTGQNVALSVAAGGINNTYQWQKNKTDISNATSATYSLTNAQKSDEGLYRVIVAGTCGADTSDEAQLVVNPNSIEYSELPDGSLKIENVMPNPAVTTTHILLKTTNESVVNVSVIDATGATVQEIFKGNINGDRTIAFDTKNLASGSYWIIAEQDGQKVRYELRVVR